MTAAVPTTARSPGAWDGDDLWRLDLAHLTQGRRSWAWFACAR